MIQKLRSAFESYWHGKSLHKLENQLVSISDSCLNVEQAIQSFKNGDGYIPLVNIQHVRGKFKKELLFYFQQNDMLAYPNEKLSSVFMRKKSIIISIPKYQHVEKMYMELKIQYSSLHRTLEDIEVTMEKAIVDCRTMIDRFNHELIELKKSYLSFSVADRLIHDYKKPMTFYHQATLDEITDTTYQSFRYTIEHFEVLRKEWNHAFVQRELEVQKEFLSDIDGRSLDTQQRTAVVTEEDNNLVLAGAGSGKTLTIAAKVKYLVEKKEVNAQEILLLSFTNKTVSEMEERINDKMKLQVDVKTFHSLGMRIIQSAREITPSVLDPENNHIIDQYLKHHVLKDKDMLLNIVTFFGVYFNTPKDKADFENLGDYLEKNSNIDLETLKGKIQSMVKQRKTIQGEKTKSIEETIIANFLFIHGINYVYERNYEYPTADKYHRQYQPDFYLPDYGIYIEHFGITENHSTPWLSPVEQEKYLNGMNWKRQLHIEKNTKLIETFSYYNKSGVLLSKLEEQLMSHGVQYQPVDTEEIFMAITDQNKISYYNEFRNLVSTFVNLFKSNGYTMQQLQSFKTENHQINQDNTFIAKRNLLFFEIIEKVFTHYEETLKTMNQIDFNDMINEATRIAESDESHFHYRYIIIDEYQDISQSRFKLIHAIKKKTNAKILCVGDDWQSIYRFAGSDLDLFTHFSHYFGYSELLRIENTYRNSQELIDIAGKFVMKNERQFKKTLRSDKHATRPIKIVKYDGDKIDVFRKIIQSFKNDESQSIMILGRNNKDLETLIDIPDDFYFNKSTRQITYIPNKQLNLFFQTVHRSKGMEADQVILINAENKMNGFPNKISDDPLLYWVLTDADQMEFAEERRLFYVALTRTKNNLFIIAPEKDSSIFVNELVHDYPDVIDCDQQLVSIKLNELLACPKCHTGRLMERRSETHAHKPFVGCSNYPGCDQTYHDIRIINDNIRCTCGGFMVRRRQSQSNIEFFGCTNYPYCKKTTNLREPSDN